MDLFCPSGLVLYAGDAVCAYGSNEKATQPIMDSSIWSWAILIATKKFPGLRGYVGMVGLDLSNAALVLASQLIGQVVVSSDGGF